MFKNFVLKFSGLFIHFDIIRTMTHPYKKLLHIDPVDQLKIIEYFLSAVQEISYNFGIYRP